MSGGTEGRKAVMPTAMTNGGEEGGYVLPPYDYAGNIEPPNSAAVGVTSGGSIGDILSGVYGIKYYADVIGFGKASTLGINYFMKSGLTCDNGADMWTYFEGIPKGDMLGKKIQQVMKDMNLPPLKGLAPGMIEDMQEGLNPRPLIQATFGSAYPKCVKVTYPVGDTRKRISDPQTGDIWIKGDVTYIGDVPAQTRWIQAKDGRGDPVYMNRDQYDNTPKTMNADGTPAPVPASASVKEGFDDNGRKASLFLAVVFLCGAVILKSL